MRRALFAVSIAACGGSKTTTTTTPSEPATAEQGSAGREASGPPGDSHESMTSIAPDALAWQPLDGQPGVAAAAVPAGRFVKYPAGHAGTPSAPSSDTRAVVVAGTVTTSQGTAPLAPGSSWSQPASASLAVRCGGGAACIVYEHAARAGSSAGARYSETRATDATWSLLDPATPGLGSRAPLWGEDAAASGMLVKMPPGSPEHWHIHKAPYHAVVLAGTVVNTESGSDGATLPAGAYWSQPGGYKHSETCKAGGPECLVYVHHDGPYLYKPM